MPSPGASALQNELDDIAFVIHGEHSTVIKKTSSTIVSLAAAMDTGWTSATPATASTMVASFSIQFVALVGDGLDFMHAVAAGIDGEVALWIASFNAITSVHEYIPGASDIEDAIKALSPIESDGSNALVEKISSVFADNFDGAAG